MTTASSKGRLNVLFLTNWYPEPDAPARAVWVREHAKAARLYDDIAVLHCAGPDRQLGLGGGALDTEESEREGIPTYRSSYRSSVIPRMAYFKYVRSVVGAFRHIVARGFRPQIIHVHIYDAAGPALMIGKLHRIPVVVTEQFTSFARRVLGPLDFCKAWLAFRWSDRVLPVSHAMQAAIESYGIHARFQVVPNVVDPRVFSPAMNDRRENQTKRLLFVGQLVPRRGLDYLFQALSDLRRQRDDWHLDIVGDGEARREYERQAKEFAFEDRVTFHGMKTKDEVADFMRRADLFVLPSLCETFSVPVAEALACGIPVVATRCGGPEEFVNDRVGVIVPPADAHALRDALSTVLDTLHRYSREEISRYALQRFSPPQVGGELHAIYHAVAAG